MRRFGESASTFASPYHVHIWPKGSGRVLIKVCSFTFPPNVTSPSLLATSATVEGASDSCQPRRFRIPISGLAVALLGVSQSFFVGLKQRGGDVLDQPALGTVKSVEPIRPCPPRLRPRHPGGVVDGLHRDV